MAGPRVEIHGLRLPVLEGPCDVGELVARAAEEQGVGIRDGDIVAVAAKLVSKCRGLLVRLDEVEPSPEARRIAELVGEDPRFVELVLRESDDILLIIPVKRLVEEGVLDLLRLSKDPEAAARLLREYPVLFLVARGGELWTDAGIDSSNHPPGVVSLPPRDPDAEAKRIRDRIEQLTGRKVAVVICDTEAFPAGGSIDIARGSYGMEPVDRGFGSPDLYGKPKYGGVDAVAHEACAAAALVAKQAGQGVPVAIIRGAGYEPCSCGLHDRLRPDPERAARVVRESLEETARVLGAERLLEKLARLLPGRPGGGG